MFVFNGNVCVAMQITALTHKCPAANLFSLTMLRQHSQYDSRLGFSFRVRLGYVRVRVRVSFMVMVMVRVLG